MEPERLANQASDKPRKLTVVFICDPEDPKDFDFELPWPFDLSDGMNKAKKLVGCLFRGMVTGSCHTVLPEPNFCPGPSQGRFKLNGAHLPNVAHPSFGHLDPFVPDILSERVMAHTICPIGCSLGFVGRGPNEIALTNIGIRIGQVMGKVQPHLVDHCSELLDREPFTCIGVKTPPLMLFWQM